MIALLLLPSSVPACQGREAPRAPSSPSASSSANEANGATSRTPPAPPTPEEDCSTLPETLLIDGGAPLDSRANNWGEKDDRRLRRERLGLSAAAPNKPKGVACAPGQNPELVIAGVARGAYSRPGADQTAYVLAPSCGIATAPQAKLVVLEGSDYRYEQAVRKGEADGIRALREVALEMSLPFSAAAWLGGHDFDGDGTLELVTREPALQRHGAGAILLWRVAGNRLQPVFEGTLRESNTGNRCDPSAPVVEVGLEVVRLDRQTLRLSEVAYPARCRGGWLELGERPIQAVKVHEVKLPTEVECPLLAGGSDEASAVPPPRVSADQTLYPPDQVTLEPSSFGRFTVDFDADGCRVHFQAKDQAPKQVFAVEACVEGGMAGVHALDRVEKLQGRRFPMTLANGDEVHLFRIAAARGGNAVEGDELWAVVVRKGRATADSFYAPRDVLLVPEGVPPDSLRLRVEPTTTDEGAQLDIRFTGMVRKPLRRLPSKRVKSERIEGTGELEGRFHSSGYHPLVALDGRQHVVEHEGRCRFPNEYGVPIRATLRVDTFDDGRTEVTCLALKREQ